MGLFNRFLHKNSTTTTELVSAAYRLGHAQGQVDGAAEAMESMAETFDSALSSMEFSSDLMHLMQMISRHSKQMAAELTEGVET